MQETELANVDKPVNNTEEQEPAKDADGNELPPWLANPEYEKGDLWFYLQSENSLVILGKRWVSMSAITFLVYALHLCMAIFAVNVYTDVAQSRKCNDSQTHEQAAKVYSMAIGLSAVWHMIEWNRAALHFFSALVEVNMIQLYYAASINVPFGFIVCFIAIGARYGGAGSECAEVQQTRATYLSLHILFLILYIFTCFHHVIIFKIMGNDWCHETINEPDEESDDEEEEGEDGD